MTGHGSKFGRKKEDAIAAMLTRRTIEEAAESVNISKQTLLRWLKIPEFRVALLDARRQAFSQANARLQQAASAAVTTLVKIMLDPQEPAAARVRAADRVLERAREGIQFEDLEIRLDALEQQQNRKGSGQPE